jgi:PAS domain S-box-containing protein
MQLKKFFQNNAQDLILFAVFTPLGIAAAYLSINVPHTEVFIEIRFLFGYTGFILIKRKWLGFLLIAALSLSGFHIVPLHVAFFGNLLYAVPSALSLRFFYKKVLSVIKNPVFVGLLHAAAVMAVYQIFAGPIIWLIRAILNEEITAAYIFNVYRIQPYLEESIVTAILSALIIVIYRFYSSLKHNQKYISTLLHSIGDAVIATDVDEQVTLMNPAAERLTGWQEEEAKDKTLSKIFDIRNAKSGEHVENPVSKVLKEGCVVGLANHTVLHAKDGRHYHISDSGAPIRDHEGVIRGVVLVFRDISEEYSLREQVRADLKEKNILLSEIHHRVKNNLQIINSLLALQANYLRDDSLIHILDDSRKRLISMSLIHEQLYRSGNFSSIDFKQYTQKLFTGIVQTYTSGRNIQLQCDIENVFIDMQNGIPVGLILNELISNSIKHGFREQTNGTIRISIVQQPNKGLLLHYSDSGSGLPDDIDLETADTLGLQLVGILARQLKASVKIENNEGFSLQMEIADNK